MKRFIAVLLCLIAIASLFSCYNSTNDDTDTPKKQAVVADYSKVLDIYRAVIESLSADDSKNFFEEHFAELGIVDEQEKELFKKLYGSTFDFKSSPPYRLTCGYALGDLNGDGIDELVLMNDEYYIIAVFSYSDGNPVLLGNYWQRNRCWIDNKGYLYVHGSNGAMNFSNQILKINKGGASLKLISEFGADDILFPSTYYYKIVKGERASITENEYNELSERYGMFLDGADAAKITKEYSGLVFTPLYTEAEIAQEAYEFVLDGSIMAYDSKDGKYVYLKDCLMPYSGIPLCEMGDISYTYLDMDGDLLKEIIIEAGDTFILRYFEGTVYVYELDFRALYNLKTDGSYSWNDNSVNFEYGDRKMYFEGNELKERDIWRIVNDGEPNAEYFLGENRVTQEELLRYIEENPREDVEFTPYDAPWLYEISYFEARNIACEYWKSFFTSDEVTLIVVNAANDWAPESVYVLVLKHFVIDHYSTIDEIWIDKNTGEAIVPYDNGGK